MPQGGAPRGPRTAVLPGVVQLPPTAPTLFLVVQREPATAMRAQFHAWFVWRSCAGL
jgi:hypothetical protein